MVRPLPVLNVLSVLIVVFSIAMLLPLGISFMYGDAARRAYYEAVLITFVSGATLWVVTRSRQAELQTRDGFLLVALVWTVLPAFATLPLLIYMPGLSFTDAYFEAVAALTTTGSTVLSGLDKLPPSINLWRCEMLSTRLDRALVLQGDVTDEGLLEAENVSDMDLFVAVTNDDENNIMSCLLAKRMGARRVVALINRRSYVDLLQAGQIDIAISPAQATIGTLLAHVRRGHVTRVHSLRRGAAEALEAVVHGDRDSCRCVGRRIEEIDLPKGAAIAAIVRSDKVIMPHHDTVVLTEDHLIVFVTDKKLLPKVEKLFEVSVGFV